MLADPQNKKLTIFFAGLAGAAVILILGVNFLLKLLPLEEKSPPQALEPIETKTQNDQPAIKGAPVYKIIEPDVTDPRPVIYTNEGFSPTNLTIKASDPIGCLITVINRTSSPIRVGVSPHNPAGDPGANYGKLAPGEYGLYDVRYPGLTEIKLHSHPETRHEFAVLYGEGCW